MKTPDMKSIIIKNLASLFLITLLASAQCVSAHVNHNHSYITETAARKVGKDTAAELTMKMEVALVSADLRRVGVMFRMTT